MSAPDSIYNKPLKTRSWLFLFILSAIIFFFVVYYFSQIKKEFRLLEKVNIYWLVIAFIAQFMTYFFAAIIYRTLALKFNMIQIPRVKDFLKAAVISLFFNQTMPSAGVSGNAFFFNFLTRFKSTVTKTLSLIVTELLIFYLAMEVLILFLLISCLTFFKASHIIKITLVTGLIVYMVFGILIILAGKKKSLEWLIKKIQHIKFLNRLFTKTIRGFEQQGVSNLDLPLVNLFRHQPYAALKIFFFQIMVIAADGFTIYALFKGSGIQVSVFIVLLSLISTRIISLVPFLPGSLILYESSMSFFFVSLGIPLGTAIIVTLVYRLLSFWFPMPIGMFFYRRWLKEEPATVLSPPGTS